VRAGARLAAARPLDESILAGLDSVNTSGAFCCGHKLGYHQSVEQTNKKITVFDFFRRFKSNISSSSSSNNNGSRVLLFLSRVAMQASAINAVYCSKRQFIFCHFVSIKAMSIGPGPSQWRIQALRAALDKRTGEEIRPGPPEGEAMLIDIGYTAMYTIGDIKGG